jgi:hypothetical protein
LFDVGGLKNGNVVSSSQSKNTTVHQLLNSSKEKAVSAAKPVPGAAVLDAKPRPKNAPVLIVESNSSSTKTGTNQSTKNLVSNASLSTSTTVSALQVNGTDRIVNGVKNELASKVEPNSFAAKSQLTANASSRMPQSDAKKCTGGHIPVSNTTCTQVTPSTSAVLTVETARLHSIPDVSRKDNCKSSSPNKRKSAQLDDVNAAVKSAKKGMFSVRATTEWHVSSLSNDRHPEKNSCTVHATTVWRVSPVDSGHEGRNASRINSSSSPPLARISSCNGKVEPNHSDVSSGTTVVRNERGKQKCSDDESARNAISTCNGSSETKLSPKKHSQSMFSFHWIL